MHFVGELYSIGLGNEGELGDGQVSDGTQPHFRRALYRINLPDGQKVKDIAASGMHSLCLTEKGRSGNKILLFISGKFSPRSCVTLIQM